MKVNVTICNTKKTTDGEYKSCIFYKEIEQWDTCDTAQKVYKAALKEYGRCTSKIYIDVEGQAKHIGWAFEKQVKYEDSNETYLQETWIVPYKSYEIEDIVHKEYALNQ